ncbi:MAG: glycoside hydrolase family 13 protein [Clostridiaceae bacterium]|jgi:4-alpha-glucanotransferase|nr:glycoside hydrolase family 13 protein [Clostridiaceae bacterium]
MLTLRHDVRSAFYRAPTGPVPVEADVNIRLVAEGDGARKIKSARLFYVYGLESFTKGHILMTLEESATEDDALTGKRRNVYTCCCPMSDVPGLFFYWFEVRLTDRRYFWCFPDPHSFGLTGVSSDRSLPFSIDGSMPIPGFQITVYSRGFRTPDWMKGAVMYQIFPDRFNRGGTSFEDHKEHFEKRPERIWHSSWDDDVDIKGKSPEGYQACDFFGGTLKGIRDALPGLASSGVTVLYLNPIYEAQSNHRYDTGDYLKVDPILGQNESLIALFEEASRHGIRVILDIAMSHTGADSRYFNRFGRYDAPGAFQARLGLVDSPYESWYRFLPSEMNDAASVIVKDLSGRDRVITYDAWWGFPLLPNINEDDLTYSAFMLGEDGVLAKWLRAGCSGFRLDVSDELPDTFLRRIRKCVKKEMSDAYIVGEVWEEPTSKISYGQHRDFLFGRTHDAVMGYEFRRHVLDFLTDKVTAETFAYALQKIIHVTPAEALYTQMNLMGSHDTCRVITLLAGRQKPSSRRQQQSLFLNKNERRKGEMLTMLAALMQLAFPGVMALYYGDEIGMEGYDDPFNRRTYPERAYELLTQGISVDVADNVRLPFMFETFVSLQEEYRKAEAFVNAHLHSASSSKSSHKTKKGAYSYALMPVFSKLTRLRRNAGVLRSGYFEIIEAHDDLIFMRRFLDSEGRDVFRHQDGLPNEAFIAINRGNEPQKILSKGIWPDTVDPYDGFIIFKYD